MTEHVLTAVENRVMTISMNRPEKKNALTGAMYDAMSNAIRQAENDASVRAILLRGTADCFTAGNDLVDFANAKPGEPSKAIEFLKTLSAARKPLIAAVAGVAVGIGTTMLLHCDVVYAAPSARFQMPFVNLGLCPEAGSSLILPMLVGHHRAAELLMFGEPFDASAAREYGIVNQIYADGELLSSAVARAQQLAEKPPGSLCATKHLLKSGASAAIEEAMMRETKEFAARLQGPEAKEAMAAFMERRKPDFSRF